MPEAASAIADERLTATQADLRRLALSARELQPARIRQAAPAGQSQARPMAIVGGESRSLHGCPPEHLAEFTMYSAMLTPAEPRRAGAVFAASQRF
jgi:hypothetical protein